MGRAYSLWVDACQVLERLGLLGGRDLLENKRAELLKSVLKHVDLVESRSRGL